MILGFHNATPTFHTNIYMFIMCRKSYYFEDIVKIEDNLQLFPGLIKTLLIIFTHRQSNNFILKILMCVII